MRYTAVLGLGKLRTAPPSPPVVLNEAWGVTYSVGYSCTNSFYCGIPCFFLVAQASQVFVSFAQVLFFFFFSLRPKFVTVEVFCCVTIGGIE